MQKLNKTITIAMLSCTLNAGEVYLSHTKATDCSVPNITTTYTPINSLKPEANPTNPEELLQLCNQMIGFSGLQRNYSESEKQIIEYLQETEFIKLSKCVQDLAKKLEKDNNPFAEKYLENLKDFEFTYTAFYTVVVGQKTVNDFSNYPWYKATADVINTPFAVFNKATGADSGFSFRKTQDITAKLRDKVTVKPYYGKVEYMEKQIPMNQ